MLKTSADPGLEPRPVRADTEHMRQVADELRAVVEGEVRFDDASRALYATDASPYEIKPHGIVLPKDVDDVRAVVEVANRHGLPILPRGGGTSLAGQTVGAAIVVDFSKYMTRVLELNVEEGWVKAEPGVVRDNLNRMLAPHQLQFTPDISTTAQANIGGMVANNSAGTRSIKYGKSVDQVIAMTVMLADGSIVELSEVSDEVLQEKLQQPGSEGDLYRTVHNVVTDHADEIEARYPKVMRRVGGYNLDEFTDGKPFNLAKLVSGSEGTLALILDVTLKLYPVPTHRCMALVHFRTLVDALTAVRYINRHGPSAVEILDDHLFELGRQNPALEPLLSWVEGEPAAVLMVEFDGESEDEMLSGLSSLQADLDVADLSYHTYVAYRTEEQEEVLRFRRGGLGIYATIKGDAKPTPFIEDSAIPVEHLPDYIPEVLAVCEKHGAKAVLYAHASVGVIHIRPLVNLKSSEGIDTFQNISEDVFQLVKKYGGSWSGEHGDGLIRSYQNKNLFGETLYEDFRRIKRAFDPNNLMNPGKIVEAQKMTENLRYGTDYHADVPETYFNFDNDGGYLGAIEACTGVGNCRKTDTGTMCPSYMATRDEDHSTRGRANILREALNGRLSGGLTSQEVYDGLDLCLSCKACKAECPSQVDMAKIKYEFLQHYYDEHGTPLSVRAIGNVARLAPLVQKIAPLANTFLPLKPIRYLMEKVIKVDRRRVLPLYANTDFGSWFKRHKKGQNGQHAQPETQTNGNGQLNVDAKTETRPTVALFADTWTMYNEPEIGIAATKVLEALGYHVEMVNYRCCGRPQISKGLLKDAKKVATGNVAALHDYVERGVPVVGLEPSCVTAFQDDYRDLVPSEQTEAVAKNVKMIDQFLAKEWAKGRLEPEKVFHQNGVNIMLHGHCQQRAIMGTNPTKAVLGWASKNVSEVDSGCCGMAGSFGYGHHDVSMTIGEQRLFPAVREHDGETVACGFSCRHQIKDGTGKRAKHIAEIMAEALKE
ncbi:MAG: FAD-linked oxidase C-terminal domain-containing protein [Trueperaceae bacterium]|nr:FAD-linked oxidase C-terminal domain-containing protein [Trueperaceae bacterium]